MGEISGGDDHRGGGGIGGRGSGSGLILPEDGEYVILRYLHFFLIFVLIAFPARM